MLWPADVPIDAIAGPAWVQPDSSDATLEDLGRGIESCVYWSAVLGPFDANNSYVATMLETRSGFNGRFPVEVRINYDDLPTPSDALHMQGGSQETQARRCWGWPRLAGCGRGRGTVRGTN